MIHSGYPVVNPWSINVKGVFWGEEGHCFKRPTKGSFCLKSFTTNFHIQHLPQNPSVFPAEIHSNVRSRWDAGETEVGHRRLGEVAQTFWRLGEVQGSTTAHISNFAGYVLMLQRFMANLLKAARLSATWKRPNLFSPAWCTGGHGHAKFWGSGCEGGTSWLGQTWNSSGSIIWVTYIPNKFSFKVFLHLFSQKNQQVRRFCLFQNPSHQFFGRLLSSGSCCNRDAGSHCIGRSHGSKFQPSKDTSTQLGASQCEVTWNSKTLILCEES